MNPGIMLSVRKLVPDYIPNTISFSNDYGGQTWSDITVTDNLVTPSGFNVPIQIQVIRDYTTHNDDIFLDICVAGVWHNNVSANASPIVTLNPGQSIQARCYCYLDYGLDRYWKYMAGVTPDTVFGYGGFSTPGAGG